MDHRDDPASALRAEARRLLRELRGTDPSTAAVAAERFLALRAFADRTAPALLAARDRVRLKHALAVVAGEHGFASWLDLKRDAAAIDDPELMFDAGFAALLNSWFADYAEAREALRRHGGYLLPYRRQFVVCESEAIRLLGLDPDDPDWELAGHDWLAPRDRGAWLRLRAKRLAVRRAGKPRAPSPGAR